MKPMDQMQVLGTYSRLLTSKTPLDAAYEQLGDRVRSRQPGESASDAFARSGIHPVACAILSGSEIAGRSGEGADRASDWLADREKRNEEFISPAQRQVFMSLGLLAAIFALPILTNGMFGQIPSDYVTIQHTPLSQFLINMYERFYEPINPYVTLGLILGTLGGAGYALVKTENPLRNRLPLMAPMNKLHEQEQLTAWLSMYIPFHSSNLPFADFVRAGKRAFKTGLLAKGFTILLEDVERGEADSLATAATMHPHAIPGNLSKAIAVMADMDHKAGQKHLRALLMLSGREMRNLAGQINNQGRRLKMFASIVVIGTLLFGIYGPLYMSMGATTV